MAGIARSSLGARGRERDLDRDLDGHPEDREIWPGKVARTDELEMVRDDRLGDIARLRRALHSMEDSGQELPQGVAAQFSRLLGADLSAVRVHASGPAADHAAAIGARAFTHGTHIAFAPGTYQPESASTQHVLAHELVHVVQNQRAGGQAMQLAARLDVGPSGSSVEVEAEAGAAALSAGNPFQVSSRSALPGISLFGGNDPAQASSSQSTSSPDPSSSAWSSSSSSSSTDPSSSAPSSSPADQSTPSAATPAGSTPGGASSSATPAGTNGPASSSPDAGGANASGAASTPGATAGPAAQQGPTAGVDPNAPKPTATPTPAGETKALDARIAQILEQRADPAAKATYQKGIGQVQALRLQALQYSFQKSGFGNTLFQTLVFPTEAVADHWGQVYATNSYRGGNGNSFVDGLQATIEGLRGLLHIIGDLAAIVSAWAGMVAIVAGLIALIGAETGVLAVVGGAVAAIADSVSVMAGLLKIMLDCIDALLGFIQMIILVIRARCSKDPGERARFAQLLHKEAGDMAANIVGVGMQCAVLVATAGVGVGMTKGISKLFTKEFGHAFGEELGKLLNPRVVFKGGIKGIAEKFAVRQVGKGVVKAPLGGKTVAVAGEDVLKLQVLKRVAGRVTKEREIVAFTTKNQMNGARLVRCNAALRKLAVMDITAVPTAGLTAASITVQSKAPNAASISRPGSAGGIQVPEKPAGAMTTVGVWPSLLEQFANAKAPLGGAIKRTEEQYENAKEQAGPELAAQVDAKLKEVSARSQAQNATASAVATDATAGKANAEQGADVANKGNAEKTKAAANQSKIDSETTKVQNEGGKLKPPPPKDGVLGTLYNMTIGKIGSWIGGAQNWIKNFLGKSLMLAAGFSKEDLDLAGIEDDMRTDATRDTQSEKDAAETQAQADPVQKAVYELMADKTTDEQAAIQGMAEAKGLIEALEEADRALDEAIKNGNLYLEEVTPILEHELETQTEGKAIDGAYVAPVIGYADAFVASIEEDSTGDTAQSQGNAALDEMHAAFSALDIGPGRTKIASIVTQYKTARATEVGQAKAGAEKIKTQIGAFVGTTDYAGVNANAQALDQLAHDFDVADNALADELYREINLVLTLYSDAIDKAIEDAMAAPDGAADTDDANATPGDANTSPGDANATPAGASSTPADASSTPAAPNATPAGPNMTPAAPNATPAGPNMTPAAPNATPATQPTAGQHVAKLGGRHGAKLRGDSGDPTPAPAAPAGQAAPAPAAAASGPLSIKSNTTATAAAGANDRYTVGVGEEVTFSSSTGESGDWTASGGTPTTATGPSLVWNAPGKAGQFTIQLKVGTSVATKSVAVITPTGVVFTVSSTYGPSSPDMMGAGMELDMQLQPLHVSFTKATIREQAGGAHALSGYFKNVKADLSHKPTTEPTTIRDDNKTGSYDEAYLMDNSADPWPKPLQVGSMTWHIPYLYSAAGVTDASFAIVAQTMGIVDSKGTVTVTKGAASTSRTPTPPIGSTPGSKPVARKADGAGVAPDAEASLAAAASSTGAALPVEQRQQLEQQTGADLSGVRIHTGAESQAAAAAVGAKAYAVGEDIHFGAGQFDPSSRDGQHLIAHEVAHTIQQRDATQARQDALEISDPHDHAEREADRFADAVVHGDAPVAMAARGQMIAREVLPGTNPAERTDATGAAITTHRAPGLGDTTNPPATVAPPAVSSRTANVRVVATELAPLHVVGAICPATTRIYEEGPAATPAPSGYTTVTGQQGTVDAPMVEQVADPGIYIANQPTADDVQQGGIGDCYFMATLMGVAARDPGHIKSIMTADGSGGASVRLYRRQQNERGFFDWLTNAAPTYTYIPVDVAVSADLAVRVSNNRVYGAQLHCAPGPKSQDYYAKITGTNLEVHRKDTFELARWAPLMEKAYARFAEVHGKYGGAHGDAPAAGSGYAGIDGGVGTYTFSVLYGAAAAAAGADVHDVQVNSFPAGGGNVLAANPRVVDQLCLLAGRGESAAPGDTDAPLILANTDPASQILNLEKAIPLAIADPDWAAIGATRQAKILAVQAAITAWKALPPDTGTVTAKKTAQAAVGTACVEAARTPNTDYLDNLRSWVRTPIQFANDSDAVPADRIAGLHTMGRNIDIMIGNGTLVPFNINVVGHASSTGDPTRNQTLSENRAANVSAEIQAGGTNAANMAKNNFTSSGVGSTGAGPGPEWRRAEVTVEPQQGENELLGAARSIPIRRMMDIVLNCRNLGTDHSGGQRNVYAGHAYSVLAVSFVTSAGVPVPLASVTGAARQAMFPQVDAMVSTVRLRNPHHGNEPDRDGMNHEVPGDGIPAGRTADGIFTMTLDGFFRNFNWIGSGVLPKT